MKKAVKVSHRSYEQMTCEYLACALASYAPRHIIVRLARDRPRKYDASS
jgi:hypothetical protein